MNELSEVNVSLLKIYELLIVNSDLFMLMLEFALIFSIIIMPIMMLTTWREKKNVWITFAVGQAEGQWKDFTISIVLCLHK